MLEQYAKGEDNPKVVSATVGRPGGRYWLSRDVLAVVLCITINTIDTTVIDSINSIVVGSRGSSSRATFFVFEFCFLGNCRIVSRVCVCVLFF